MTQLLLQAADLRGAARLSTEAVAGLASLVKAMHSRITTLPRLPVLGQAAAANESSAETLLGWLAPALAAADPHLPAWTEREAILAALNGLLGDHLAATRNPLAIEMAFRHSGGPLLLDRYELRAHYGGATPRVLVLLHELCMNDLQWQQAGHDHGEALARELGYAPVYLHYNSGLSVSTNGRILAPMMERLYDVWPVPVERLVMIGHGMGGLVARSAIHHGALLQRGGLRWPGRVNDLVCLGTPHQGAPLGRAAQDVDLLLGAAPYAAPLARLGKLRSAGINDLRLGNVLSAPSGDDGTQRGGQAGLPGGSRCFAVAASLDPAPGHSKARLQGDGLVPVPSALGQHGDREFRLDFEAQRQVVVHGTGHLELLSSPEVGGLLRRWLG